MTTDNLLWATVGSLAVAGKTTANNLYYDGGNSRRSWSSANSLCQSKGMRLPYFNETNNQISGGVSSYLDGTITGTLSGGNYKNWFNTNYSDWQPLTFTGDYVRCVK